MAASPRPAVGDRGTNAERHGVPLARRGRVMTESQKGTDARRIAELGEATPVPWDIEHFGFPVWHWAVSPRALAQSCAADVELAVSAWATRTEARLLSASLPGTDLSSVSLLQGAGFRVVDYALAVRHARLQHASFQLPDLPVREATPDDRAGVLEIAGTGFSFGRYHTDPQFPRALANRRYVRWVDAALAGADPDAVVLVTGPAGRPSGFMYAGLAGSVARLHLAGVAPEFCGGPTSVGLYVGAIKALRDRGARVAESAVSAANIAVINLYAGLGFRFSAPRVVMHRHFGALGGTPAAGESASGKG